MEMEEKERIVRALTSEQTPEAYSGRDVVLNITIIYRCAAEDGQQLSLEDFVREDDLDMYGDATAQKPASKSAQKQASGQTLHIPNGSTASSFTIPPPPSPELSQRSSFAVAKAREVKKDPSQVSDALAPIMRICNLHIDISAYESKDVLYSHLRNLDLTREDRMRPGWDRYFMTLAGLASLRWATI